MSTDLLGHQLDLAGSYDHPHWLAFLCSGLSAAGVSVVSGRAVRGAATHWDGHLVVSGPMSAIDPMALAATRPVRRDAGRLRLTSYRIERRPDGQLEVDVEAPDELGFFGRLLSRVSLLALVPSEIELATVGSVIQDTVVLGGIGHTGVSSAAESALNDLMKGALG
jgi:hypothetical protein